MSINNAPDTREIDCLRLALTRGISLSQKHKLLEMTGDPGQCLEMLKSTAPEHLNKLHLPSSQELEEIIQQAQRGQFLLLTRESPEYPERLNHLSDPPLALFIKGRAETLLQRGAGNMLAIVGSRRASPYGLGQAEMLSRELAQLGITVVSGVAKGIDAAAHRGCLAGGGTTIGVTACGFRHCYPAENRALHGQIARHGCLVTEYPPNTAPQPWQFPARNRLIAALTRGVIVVEASQRSGALITADLAGKLGRTVMALPGSLNSPLSQGTLQLIYDGAVMVRGLSDVLEQFGIFMPKEQDQAPDSAEPNQSLPSDHAQTLSPTQTSVLEAIGEEGAFIDDLTEATGLNSGQVSGTLTWLEVSGSVRQLPTGLWIRTCPLPSAGQGS